MLSLKNLTKTFITEIQKKSLNIKKIGVLLGENWRLKKKFTNEISNNLLDKIYKDAIDSGCYGGKLLGAGGGGFFLFVCQKKYHKKVVKKLKRCERVDLNLINSSANIIYSE